MSREIKFRAWNDENSFMYFDVLVASGGYVWSMRGDVVSYGGLPPMQYTGLKDKNGVEIYEGDVVLVGSIPEKTVVTFFEGCFYTVTKGGNYRCGGWNQDAIEVIGNIHEHPHLLEGKGNE